MKKSTLRKVYKEQRNSLKPKEKHLKEALITHHCLGEIRTFKSVGIYFSTSEEIDTQGIIQELLNRGVQVYLPRVEGDRIDFHPYKDGDLLELSPYGILEPKTQPVTIDLIDVMIVPMLAFNPKGYRLGYGGGYYDKALAHYEGFIIGLAYENSLSLLLNEEAYDVRCHRIITEREVKFFE